MSAFRAFALLALLFAVGCGGGSGGGSGSPTASRTAASTATLAPVTATASATASPSEPATATATVSASPSRSASATATPSQTPTLSPTPPAACDVPGTICTMAGTGLSLFDGDGRPALETSFYYPLDIVFDARGRPLILDWNNLRLRRLNDDQTIETVMGSDVEDFPVDGGLAKDTPLHHPTDFERDAAGNLYVAGNHVPVVFRVDSSDRVFTLAGTTEFGNDGDGGPARQARLTEPYGVAPDAAGGFYLSDSTANVVRYVDAEGIIRTVAGTGARGYGGDGGPATGALLDSPTRLQVDVDGDLYFCDTDNHAIRRLRDGTITTIAGTGVPGYDGDGGPAQQARFNAPYDLRFSPEGDLYVADTGNNVVRRIDGEGRVTTVVGTGARGFAGDEGDAVGAELNRPSAINFSADGSLWIADTFNLRVRRVKDFLQEQGGTPGPTRTRRPTSPPTATPSATPTGIPPEDAIETIAGDGTMGDSGDGGLAGEARLNSPAAVVVGAGGEVVIADFGNHRVRAIDPDTGIIETIAGTGEATGEGALPFPTDVVLLGDGSFLVASWSPGQIFHYLANGTRRLIAGSGVSACDDDVVADASGATLRLPRGLELRRDGVLMISEQGCHRIRRLSDAGLSTYAGTGVAGYDGDGGVPAAAKFSARTSPLRPVPNFGIGLSPESIADELYVADTGNNVVREIRLLANRIDTFAGTGEAGFRDDVPLLAQFDRPTDVLVTGDHAVWILDTGNHALRRVDPFRIAVTTLAGTGVGGYDGDGASAAASRLNAPGGFFVTPAGDVYIADTGNHRIRRFRFSGRR